MKRVRDVLGLVGIVLGAAGVVRDVRAATGKQDRLALVNAVVHGIGVVTGAALVIRGLRGKEDGEES